MTNKKKNVLFGKVNPLHNIISFEYEVSGGYAADISDYFKFEEVCAECVGLTDEECADFVDNVMKEIPRSSHTRIEVEYRDNLYNFNSVVFYVEGCFDQEDYVMASETDIVDGRDIVRWYFIPRQILI